MDVLYSSSVEQDGILPSNMKEKVLDSYQAGLDKKDCVLDFRAMTIKTKRKRRIYEYGEEKVKRLVEFPLDWRTKSVFATLLLTDSSATMGIQLSKELICVHQYV